MFTKKIKYTDFLGNEREEELFFHFSERDTIKMKNTGYFNSFGNLSTETEEKFEYSINLIEDLIKKSFGIISDDGRAFLKVDDSEEAAKAYETFKHSMVYDIFFNELLSDEKAVLAFLTGAFPKDIIDSVQDKLTNISVKKDAPNN